MQPSLIRWTHLSGGFRVPERRPSPSGVRRFLRLANLILLGTNQMTQKTFNFTRQLLMVLSVVLSLALVIYLEVAP